VIFQEALERDDIRRKYFRWLYDQAFEIFDVESPKSYVYLCSVLHSIAFGQGVPNDDNRVADGEELRDEFIATQDNIGVEEYVQMSNLGRATLLEVLVALSRRAHPIAEILTPMEWFQKFLKNLSLLKYNDLAVRPHDEFKIERVLRRWNSRRYDPDGKGGLFPLNRPQNDQREVELWYQMSAYMTENHMY
jgi:hypothetical protein